MYTKSHTTSPKFIDITGRRFGKLIASEYLGYRVSASGKRTHYWKCSCDCGGKVDAEKSNLVCKQIVSCGCYWLSRVIASSKTHGRSGSTEYKVWAGIKRRCNNKNDRSYDKYGKRGIKVCERWNNSFKLFLDDMGKRPSDRHSIERLDYNGDYEPSNCIWATHEVQMNNTSRNVFITHKNKTLTVSQWARCKNMKPATLHARLKVLGWDQSKALLTPVK